MIVAETLVEACITRISLNQAERSAEIELLSADGRMHWLLVAKGIDDFLMDELRLNSIVDEIFAYDAGDVENKDCVSHISHLLRGEEISKADASWPIVHKRINMLRNGELKFWVIYPVLGGLIYVLAKEILLHQK